MAGPLFTPLGDGRFRPDEATRGPWDPGAQHAGAPAALLAALLEAAEPGRDMRLARLTLELLRPVPLAEVRAEVEVVRAGRRAQVLEARVHAGGELVARARALRLRRLTDGAVPAVGAAGADAPPPGPEGARAMPFPGAERPLFGDDAVEVRFLRGGWAPGPAVAWLRLRVPVLPGVAPSGPQRALAAADFGNGVSAVLDWRDHVFVNADLTVVLERDPEGEWIALDARTRVAADGTGVAESVLHDERGRVGTATQALIVERRA